jgi:hypothetical protein
MEPSTFAQQNAERAMESANFGLSWAREFAEQALNQSKVAMDGLLKASNKMAKDFNQMSAFDTKRTFQPHPRMAQRRHQSHVRLVTLTSRLLRRLPLACELLRLGNLRGGHAPCDKVSKSSAPSPPCAATS